MSERATTPGWLAAVAIAAVGLTQVMLWVALPWQAAAAAGGAAIAAFEAGKTVARWHDDKQP